MRSMDCSSSQPSSPPQQNSVRYVDSTKTVEDSLLLGVDDFDPELVFKRPRVEVNLSNADSSRKSKSRRSTRGRKSLVDDAQIDFQREEDAMRKQQRNHRANQSGSSKQPRKAAGGAGSVTSVASRALSVAEQDRMSRGLRNIDAAKAEIDRELAYKDRLLTESQEWEELLEDSETELQVAFKREADARPIRRLAKLKKRVVTSRLADNASLAALDDKCSDVIRKGNHCLAKAANRKAAVGAEKKRVEQENCAVQADLATLCQAYSNVTIEQVEQEIIESRRQSANRWKDYSKLCGGKTKEELLELARSYGYL